MTSQTEIILCEIEAILGKESRAFIIQEAKDNAKEKGTMIREELQVILNSIRIGGRKI